MTIFHGARGTDLLELTGAVARTKRRRARAWRRAWRLLGPAALLALGLGLYAGSVLALAVQS